MPECYCDSAYHPDGRCQSGKGTNAMKEPKSYREEGITYFVGPFLYDEQIYVDCYKLRAVTYNWYNKPTGKMGVHTIFLFPEDVKKLPQLIAHWNRTEEWVYSQETGGI